MEIVQNADKQQSEDDSKSKRARKLGYRLYAKELGDDDGIQPDEELMDTVGCLRAFRQCKRFDDGKSRKCINWNFFNIVETWLSFSSSKRNSSVDILIEDLVMFCDLAHETFGVKRARIARSISIDCTTEWRFSQDR